MPLNIHVIMWCSWAVRPVCSLPLWVVNRMRLILEDPAEKIRCLYRVCGGVHYGKQMDRVCVCVFVHLICFLFVSDCMFSNLVINCSWFQTWPAFSEDYQKVTCVTGSTTASKLSPCEQNVTWPRPRGGSLLRFPIQPPNPLAISVGVPPVSV